MFTNLLIANRGEIACRIMKTARRMGIQTIAVYSTEDKQARHVQEADRAYCIGEPPPDLSYLHIDNLIKAALTAGAQAIHPGYGFLSENPRLAAACEAHGLVFIGPSVAAMEAMASKQIAKQRLEHTTVPLTPGYHGSDQTDKRLLAEAERIGFPILLKPANGGGGKGMRRVDDKTAFQAALDGTRREATAYFGDDILLIEKLLLTPRHIEIQIMADNHGHVVHLFERDCSIQRRHQKIIEEAQAPHLSNALLKGLTEAAVTVAQAIDYQGAGTVEFLVDTDEQFYFMEMNTRLQVEHPVTEMITGLDLVEWQLRIAANEPLPCTQDQIKPRGHAIECRIYAEDPVHQFLPSVGQIDFLQEPTATHVRIDSSIHVGSRISPYYDPMIAKLITWGETRQDALQRIQTALRHYHIGGIKTNIPFLQAIVHHPAFMNGELSTAFLTHETITLPAPNPAQAALMAACVEYLDAFPHPSDQLGCATMGWQLHLKTEWLSSYQIEDVVFSVHISPINIDTLVLTLDGNTVTWQIHRRPNQLHIDDGNTAWQVWVHNHLDALTFYTTQGPITVRHTPDVPLSERDTNAPLKAPMHGRIIAILKKQGDQVIVGERLMVLESMKMEHSILAPHDGVIEAIFYECDAQVSEGTELLSITPLDS